MDLIKITRMNAAVAICRYFPVGRYLLLLHTLLILKSSQFFFKFKKKCDKVQNLVRQWRNQPDRFRWACLILILDAASENIEID